MPRGRSGMPSPSRRARADRARARGGRGRAPVPPRRSCAPSARRRGAAAAAAGRLPPSRGGGGGGRRDGASRRAGGACGIGLACSTTPSPAATPWPIAWSGAPRYRSPVISVGGALRAVLDATPVLGSERVLLSAAAGRIAAEDVVSGRAVPAAANSAMDGFAVRGEDVRTAPAHLRLVGTAPAGTLLDVPIEPGTA